MDVEMDPPTPGQEKERRAEGSAIEAEYLVRVWTCSKGGNPLENSDGTFKNGRKRGMSRSPYVQ